MGKRKTPIDWKTYNNELVDRGKRIAEFIKFFSKDKELFKKELITQNKGKKGHPYEYADRLFILLAVIKAVTSKGFRFLEGFAFLLFDEVPDHNTIWRRINKANPNILSNLNRTSAARQKSGTIDIILDATGISVNGTNVWLDEKYNERRKREWVKLHLCIDAATKEIISVEVMNKNDNEGKHEGFSKHIQKANKKGRINRVYADGAYDGKKNFGLCKKNGSELVVRIRKNTIEAVKRKKAINKRMVLHGRSPMQFGYREEKAIEQINWDEFVETKNYGKRSGIEGVIGSFKRFFGESVASKCFDNIKTELLMRCSVWNLMVV